MDVFDLRDSLIRDYQTYVKSLAAGAFWPEPRIGLNPSFSPGRSIEQLVADGVLHSECERIFRIKEQGATSRPLRLHKHQDEAILAAKTGKPYLRQHQITLVRHQEWPPTDAAEARHKRALHHRCVDLDDIVRSNEPSGNPRKGGRHQPTAEPPSERAPG